jgi:hypothetical protein
MDFFNTLGNGFFHHVQYAKEFKDDSWSSQLEDAAQVCRAPSRWVAELWGEGKKYKVTFYDADTLTDDIHLIEVQPKVSEGIQKVIRTVLGILFAVPGQIAALPLMGLAYLNEEIRLKHQVAVRTMTDEDNKKLAEMIQKRLELAKERQGCEPISCLLFSICCLLCCLMCSK